MITPTLQNFVNDCIDKFDSIPNERVELLDALSKFVRERKDEKKVNLIFICVHNSRRSHLSQVWAQVAAKHYGLENVICYSGGTEVTAMYPQIAKTLASQGFEAQELSKGDNPVYGLKYATNEHPLIAFSKLFDDSFNPGNEFGAIMVCSAADSNCPYIATAAERILIPFEDPKEFDDSDQKEEKYDERSQQIATELLYAFSKV